MKLGVGLPTFEGSDLGRDVVTMAVEAEKAGASSVWVHERVLWPMHPSTGLFGIEGRPWHPAYRPAADALSVLSAAAAVTTEVRLGSAVLIAPFYHPLHLARALATIDRIAGGRLVAGFGTGWSPDEYRGMGADFEHRGAALDEAIDACRALWAEGPTSVAGTGFAIDDALVLPKPAHHIPIVLGGGLTGRSLRRIATRSDGWLASRMFGPTITTAWARVREMAADAGRDPEALTLIARANMTLTETPAGADRQPFVGTWDQIVTDIAGVAEAGADEVVLDPLMGARDGAHQIDLCLEGLDRLRAAGVIS